MSVWTDYPLDGDWAAYRARKRAEFAQFTDTPAVRESKAVEAVLQDRVAKAGLSYGERVRAQVEATEARRRCGFGGFRVDVPGTPVVPAPVHATLNDTAPPPGQTGDLNASRRAYIENIGKRQRAANVDAAAQRREAQLDDQFNRGA